MLLDIWASRWGVPSAAIQELKQSLGLPEPKNIITPGVHSEAGVSSLVKLEASEFGARLWRNNVGGTYTADGAFFRYGLANESSAINACIKSADLIGIKPVIITQNLVGITIGQFISREIKKPNWRYQGTDREKAQLRWAQLIVSLGGDACFTNGKGSF